MCEPVLISTILPKKRTKVHFIWRTKSDISKLTKHAIKPNQRLADASFFSSNFCNFMSVNHCIARYLKIRNSMLRGIAPPLANSLVIIMWSTIWSFSTVTVSVDWSSYVEEEHYLDQSMIPNEFSYLLFVDSCTIVVINSLRLMMVLQKLYSIH